MADGEEGSASPSANIESLSVSVVADVKDAVAGLEKVDKLLDKLNGRKANVTLNLEREFGDALGAEARPSTLESSSRSSESTPVASQTAAGSQPAASTRQSFNPSDVGNLEEKLTQLVHSAVSKALEDTFKIKIEIKNIDDLQNALTVRFPPGYVLPSGSVPPNGGGTQQAPNTTAETSGHADHNDFEAFFNNFKRGAADAASAIEFLVDTVKNAPEMGFRINSGSQASEAYEALDKLGIGRALSSFMAEAAANPREMDISADTERVFRDLIEKAGPDIRAPLEMLMGAKGGLLPLLRQYFPNPSSGTPSAGAQAAATQAPEQPATPPVTPTATRETPEQGRRRTSSEATANDQQQATRDPSQEASVKGLRERILYNIARATEEQAADRLKSAKDAVAEGSIPGAMDFDQVLAFARKMIDVPAAGLNLRAIEERIPFSSVTDENRAEFESAMTVQGVGKGGRPGLITFGKPGSSLRTPGREAPVSDAQKAMELIPLLGTLGVIARGEKDAGKYVPLVPGSLEALKLEKLQRGKTMDFFGTRLERADVPELFRTILGAFGTSGGSTTSAEDIIGRLFLSSGSDYPSAFQRYSMDARNWMSPQHVAAVRSFHEGGTSSKAPGAGLLAPSSYGPLSLEGVARLSLQLRQLEDPLKHLTERMNSEEGPTPEEITAWVELSNRDRSLRERGAYTESDPAEVRKRLLLNRAAFKERMGPIQEQHDRVDEGFGLSLSELVAKLAGYGMWGANTHDIDEGMESGRYPDLNLIAEEALSDIVRPEAYLDPKENLRVVHVTPTSEEPGGHDEVYMHAETPREMIERRAAEWLGPKTGTNTWAGKGGELDRELDKYRVDDPVVRKALHGTLARYFRDILGEEREQFLQAVERMDMFRGSNFAATAWSNGGEALKRIQEAGPRLREAAIRTGVLDVPPPTPSQANREDLRVELEKVKEAYGEQIEALRDKAYEETAVSMGIGQYERAPRLTYVPPAPGKSQKEKDDYEAYLARVPEEAFRLRSVWQRAPAGSKIRDEHPTLQAWQEATAASDQRLAKLSGQLSPVGGRTRGKKSSGGYTSFVLDSSGKTVPLTSAEYRAIYSQRDALGGDETKFGAWLDTYLAGLGERDASKMEIDPTRGAKTVSPETIKTDIASTKAQLAEASKQAELLVKRDVARSMGLLRFKSGKAGDFVGPGRPTDHRSVQDETLRRLNAMPGVKKPRTSRTGLTEKMELYRDVAVEMGLGYYSSGTDAIDLPFTDEKFYATPQGKELAGKTSRIFSNPSSANYLSMETRNALEKRRQLKERQRLQLQYQAELQARAEMDARFGKRFHDETALSLGYGSMEMRGSYAGFIKPEGKSPEDYAVRTEMREREATKTAPAGSALAEIARLKAELADFTSATTESESRESQRERRARALNNYLFNAPRRPIQELDDAREVLAMMQEKRTDLVKESLDARGEYGASVREDVKRSFGIDETHPEFNSRVRNVMNGNTDKVTLSNQTNNAKIASDQATKRAAKNNDEIKALQARIKELEGSDEVTSFESLSSERNDLLSRLGKVSSFFSMNKEADRMGLGVDSRGTDFRDLWKKKAVSEFGSVPTPKLEADLIDEIRSITDEIRTLAERQPDPEMKWLDVTQEEARKRVRAAVVPEDVKEEELAFLSRRSPSSIGEEIFRGDRLRDPLTTRQAEDIVAKGMSLRSPSAPTGDIPENPFAEENEARAEELRRRRRGGSRGPSAASTAAAGGGGSGNGSGPGRAGGVFGDGSGGGSSGGYARSGIYRVEVVNWPSGFGGGGEAGKSDYDTMDGARRRARQNRRKARTEIEMMTSENFMEATRRDIEKFRKANPDVSDETIRRMWSAYGSHNVEAILPRDARQSGESTTAGSTRSAVFASRQARANARAAMGITTPFPDTEDALNESSESAKITARISNLRGMTQARGITTSAISFVERTLGNTEKMYEVLNRASEYKSRASGAEKELRTAMSERQANTRQSWELRSQIKETAALGQPTDELVKRFKLLRTASIGLTEQIKRASGEVQTYNQKAKDATSEIGASDIARLFGAGLMGAGVGLVASQAISEVVKVSMAVYGKTIGPIVETGLGLPSASSRVQEGLGESVLRSGGYTGAAVAAPAASMGMNAQSFAAISDVLQGRAQSVAASKNTENQIDTFATAAWAKLESQAYGGYDKGLFDTTGGLMGTWINGQASLSEQLGKMFGNLPEMQSKKGTSLGEQIVNGLIGGFVPGWGLGQNAENQIGNPILAETAKQTYDEFMKALGNDTEGIKLHSKSVNKMTAEEKASHDKLLADAAASGEGGKSMIDFIKEMGLYTTEGQTNMPFKEIMAKFAQAQIKLPVELLMQAQEPQIKARETARMLNLQYQLGEPLPGIGNLGGGIKARFGLEQAFSPTVSPKYGLGAAVEAMTGTGVSGDNEMNKMLRVVSQEGIKADVSSLKTGAQGITDAMQAGKEAAELLVQTRLPEYGDRFASALKLASGYGTQIADLQMGIQVQQAAYGAKQFAFQLYQAKLAYSDAQGLAGQLGETSKDNLGVIERENFFLNQRSAILSQQLSQRQINFQTALAGFSAPGLTPEERAARMEQAKIEAAYAQKQLDIQKQLTANQRQSFNITASRGVTAALMSLNLLKEGYQLQIDTAKAEAKIKELAAKEKLAVEETQAIFQAAESQVGDIISQIAATIPNTTDALEAVANSVLKAFDKTISGINVSVQGLVSSLDGVILTQTSSPTYVPTTYPSDGTSGSGTTSTTTTSSGGISGSGAPKMYAGGMLGYTTGPTDVGIAGEAGTETVAILRNPRPFLMGGGNGNGIGGAVSIYVTGNNIDSKETADYVISQLVAKLGQKAALLGLRAP